MQTSRHPAVLALRVWLRTVAVLTCASLLFALALPADAGAQRRRGARSERARYGRLIREAVAEFGAHRYEEARALFREAHELQPSARTLRGVGMCSFELRDYRVAIAELSAALASRERPLTGAQQRSVEELLERARRFIGRFTVTVMPAGATLAIDGVPARFEPDGSLVLDLGHHELVASLEGHRTYTRALDVAGGERQDLEIRLEPLPPPIAVIVAPPAVHDGDDDISVPVALFIGAGAAALAGAVSSAWIGDRVGEVSICEAAGPDCLNHDTLSTQRDASIGVTVAAFTAAIGLTVAGTLLFVEAIASPPASQDRGAIACTPAGVGARCSF